jgi:hypothetical protein
MVERSNEEAEEILPPPRPKFHVIMDDEEKKLKYK